VLFAELQNFLASWFHLAARGEEGVEKAAGKLIERT
jgi:hypothetical protein